ncbi:MAG: HEAT repeat domain-containing protein, partial [Planctomycetaceae bacterium]|nr:HEAT repeat domain-containing protein [Planctomycetaceae bacterium]
PATPGQFENLPHDVAGWIERLNSESYYERLEAQLAIETLGRDDSAVVVEAVHKGKLSERGWLHGVWIIAHLLGPQASDELFKLFKLSQDIELRRVQTQAIRALADLHDPVLVEHRLDAGPGDEHIAERLSGLVHWRHPHVTLDVVVALGRMKWRPAPYWLSKKLRTTSPVIAHAAQQTLRRCGDWLEVLRLLDVPSPPPPALVKHDPPQDLPGSVSIRDIALRAIADQPVMEIVDGLEVRLRLETTPSRKREYADVLSRVHRKPAIQWVYWGFRPAPRPANTVAWERTEVIEQALDRLLAESNSTTPLAVLRRMQREKIPTRLPTLAAWLRDETDAERLAAILDSLREHPAEATREFLESAIKDDRKPDVARRAAFTQWVAESTNAGERPVVTLAKSLADGPILASVLRELGKRNSDANQQPTVSESTTSWLLDKTSSANANVRAAAMETLTVLRVAAAAERAAVLVNDEQGEVRRAAAFAVGELAARSAIPALLERMRDEDLEMRRACLDALRQLKEPRVVPLAVAALSDAVTQLAAIKCLAELGGPEQAQAVTNVAMRNSSSDVRNLAVQMLSSWSKRDGIMDERRAELERTVHELQGTSGILAAWELIGPMKPDAAAAWVAMLGSVSKSAKGDASNEKGRSLFGVGPESRLRTDGKANGIWVAYSEFSVSDPSAAQFLVSSNAPLRVWLNGKSVLERAEPRRFQPDSDRFEAELAKGTNRLLIELGNTPEASTEFHARFRQKSSKVEHERLVEAALSRTGNIERGRKLFLTVEKSNCLKCHRLGEQGEKIGPELTGIGSRFSRIHIIESLLDPSRTIAAGFQSQTVALQDGRVLSGLKISETADSLVLADNQGKKHSLRKADIEESQAHAGSIMPDGLEKTLTVDEFVDLISFLTSEKQTAGR